MEIVGAAGAGKSTLCRALDGCTEAIRLENFPDVHRLSDAPFFILNGLQLIPELLGLNRSGSRQLSRREFAWMTILKGWPTIFRQASKTGSPVIILDQGPIYLLAEMRLFGPEYLHQKAAETLWQDLYKQWRDIITTVVCLDAPNDILLERIRSRQQDHIVKTQPAQVVFEFLARYRAEYDSILSVLATQGPGPKILRFDTDRQPTQAIVNQLMSELSR